MAKYYLGIWDLYEVLGSFIKCIQIIHIYIIKVPRTSITYLYLSIL